MAAFPRTNQPTHSFARLVGTDHRKLTSASDDDSSLSLSDLVHSFLEQPTDDSLGSDSVDESANSSENNTQRWTTAITLALANNADPYRNTLHAHVSEATERFEFLREMRNVSAFRRSVAAFLKENGHDAAVCRTAWESGGGVTAGSYEFIDVARSGSRYFVDLDFRAQFEIARPSGEFLEVLSAVPVVFVGGAADVKRVVLTVCDAARRCFRSRGLSVPPWRKNRFMQNKWFAPFRRTVNPVHGNPVRAAPIRVTAVNGVSCRLVGFDDVVLEARRGGVVRTR